MSVRANPARDWTASPSSAYARSSNAALMNSRGGALQTPGTPSLSDPSTGALAQWPPALAGASAKPGAKINNRSSFVFVMGLFVITIWLESGKRGSV
jgi:hypothetical protein